MLYRRYLKAANQINNVTIRLLLVQQVRQSFRRHATVKAPTAQRELILQAHKDLAVLEDDRLQKTLFINKIGMVSCLDWEHRRTEYHFDPRGEKYLWGLLWVLAGLLVTIFLGMKPLREANPAAAEAVDVLAAKLHASSPEEYQQQEEARIRGMLSTSRRQADLQNRILTSFEGAPANPASRF